MRDKRRAARRRYSAEEKVRIVIAGLRGEDSIVELCRKEGTNQTTYSDCATRYILGCRERSVSFLNSRLMVSTGYPSKR